MATDARVKTQPVRAKIPTDEYGIEGNVHLKPGAHLGRLIVRTWTMVQSVSTGVESAEPRLVQLACVTGMNSASGALRITETRMVFPFEDS